MEEEIRNPQINISKIAVGGGIAGAFFAAVSTLIFLMGIPMLRSVFPAAIALGGIALVFHFARHKTPGTLWIILERRSRQHPPGLLGRCCRPYPFQSAS